jgi:hypothetical protein
MLGAFGVGILRGKGRALRTGQRPVLFDRRRHFTHLFIRLPQIPMGLQRATGFRIVREISFVEMNGGGIPSIGERGGGLVPEAGLRRDCRGFRRRHDSRHRGRRRPGTTSHENHEQDKRKKWRPGSTARQGPSSIDHIRLGCAQRAPTRPTPFRQRNTRSRTWPSPAHPNRAPR